MMTYTVHIRYSEHGTSHKEHFEMAYDRVYGKEMTAQKEEPTSVSSNEG